MKIIVLIGSLIGAFSTFAQTKQLTVAFYNQENLFDTIDDPHKNDNEFLPNGKNNWNTEKYFNKINHMAQVISAINPDVIGMCEIENDAVLIDLTVDSQLVKKEYGIVHFESPDERSIDNALLYKKTTLKWISSKAYTVSIDSAPNFKTRDILLAEFELPNQEHVVFLVNHFPSRLGGQQASEHKRIRAAQVLKFIFDSIQQASPDKAVIAMGDFNDEPNNASLDSVVGAHADKNSSIYNAMYPLKLSGQGSLKYRNDWNMLDQVIMNHNLLKGGKKLHYIDGSATIFKQPWMEETEEKYKGSPKRTFGGSRYLNGYSDHFPVTTKFEYQMIKQQSKPGKK